jgi:hypothetical protein
MEKWEWQITVCTPSVPMDAQRSGVKFLQSLVSGAGTLFLILAVAAPAHHHWYQFFIAAGW